MEIVVHPDWWKTLFDDLYLKTDARSVCDEDLSRCESEVIWELLSPEPGHRILDLCGGQGRHSFFLYEKSAARCTARTLSPVQFFPDVGDFGLRDARAGVRYFQDHR